MNYVRQFNALGHEDRTTIFRLLVRAGPGGKCVDEIKQHLGIPGSTLSHHLEVLSRSGLVATKRSGRFVYYSVDWPQTAQLIRFLTEDCCADMHTNLGTGAKPSRGGRPRAARKEPRRRKGKAR